jgi:MraZ protein
LINILGTYECKADSKGRIMLPAALKKQMAPFINDGFVVKRSVFNKCLEIHPMSEWKKIVGEVNKLNRFVKKNNDFIRSYMSGLKIIHVDSVSRLLVPKDLIAFASLDKEIVLSSSVNVVEVWDKMLYEESVANSLENFGNLTEEVMGGLGNQNSNDIP